MIPKTGLQIGTGPDDINLEQFQTWLTALRSGNYKQTKGALQDEFGYCCLGVGCDVLIPRHLKNKKANGELLGAGPATGQPNAPYWLREINMDFGAKTGTLLFDLNDDFKLPFPQIADNLEETYLTPYYESTRNSVQQ